MPMHIDSAPGCTDGNGLQCLILRHWRRCFNELLYRSSIARKKFWMRYVPESHERGPPALEVPHASRPAAELAECCCLWRPPSWAFAERSQATKRQDRLCEGSLLLYAPNSEALLAPAGLSVVGGACNMLLLFLPVCVCRHCVCVFFWSAWSGTSAGRRRRGRNHVRVPVWLLGPPHSAHIRGW